MFGSRNPALKQGTFSNVHASGDQVMTIQGAVNKSLILAFLVIMSASFVWSTPASFLPYLPLLVIVTFVLCLVIVFNKPAAGVLSPIYAIIEGLFLGTISSFFERQAPGIVIQAVGLTFGALFTMLTLYKFRIISPQGRLMRMVSVALGGIFFFYIFTLIGGMFGMSTALLHGSSPLSIGISVVIVGVASFSLINDFALIEYGAQAQAPKYMEWYSAFSLLVGLIWLYMEILRLLMKLNRR